ncbi:hypothetical protein LIA77_06065 [Sarocladium implicatum]|nr:hypothetical protein LIA77_06065 [Sarocladium implicatum]
MLVWAGWSVSTSPLYLPARDFLPRNLSKECRLLGVHHYVVDGQGCGTDRDRAQLKALASELFIRIPRLLMLVRDLRADAVLQEGSVSRARQLLEPLLDLQDAVAERRLMQHAMIGSL